MNHDLRDDLLAQKLRADASAWGGAPSSQARAALRAKLAALRPPAPTRWPWIAIPLAIALALAAVKFGRGDDTPKPAPRPPISPPRALDISQLEALALAPLRTELSGLAHDGRLLARSLWRGVPEPMRRLLD